MKNFYSVTLLLIICFLSACNNKVDSPDAGMDTTKSVADVQNEKQSAQPDIPVVKVSFGDTELDLTPQLLLNSDADASLIDNFDITELTMRYWDKFSIDVADAETVKISDYIDDSPSRILLFEAELIRASDGGFTYVTKHSSESPNNPYGYNEVEKRYYLITFEIAGQRFACCFAVLHNGSHL